MTTAQLRREIKQTVDRLPAGKLEKAARMVGSLVAVGAKRAPAPAGRAKIAALKRDIVQARRDAAAGRTRPWREIRSDV